MRDQIRFDGWTLLRSTGELMRGDVRTRLQGQPLQVLEELLARPGELVPREQMIARLWPNGVVVDFDTALNSAVRRLRTALDDHAEHPRYIETLPRRGYRFIGRLDPDPATDAGDPMAQVASLAPPDAASRTVPMTALPLHAIGLPGRRGWLAAAAFGSRCIRPAGRMGCGPDRRCSTCGRGGRRSGGVRRCSRALRAWTVLLRSPRTRRYGQGAGAVRGIAAHGSALRRGLGGHCQRSLDRHDGGAPCTRRGTRAHANRCGKRAGARPCERRSIAAVSELPPGSGRPVRGRRSHAPGRIAGVRRSAAVGDSRR